MHRLLKIVVDEETVHQTVFALEKQPLGSKGDKIECVDMPMEDQYGHKFDR